MIKNKLLIIDPGHGGKDPGAIWPRVSVPRISEAHINLQIGIELFNRMVERETLKVVMTRDKPTSVTLARRCKIANLANSGALSAIRKYGTENDMSNYNALFLSIHCNSAFNSSANGAEAIYWHGSQKGANAANCMASAFTKHGVIWRRNFESGFAVLRDTDIPAIIVELGFISNEKDRRSLDVTKKKNVDKYVDILELGIKYYLGI